MASISLAGDSSGKITVTVPTNAGTNTITLPAGTGTATVQGVNSNIVAVGTVSASGTAVDFTSIPSWVRRITLVFTDLSVTGSSAVGVQLGFGSIQTTGYKGGGIRFGTSGVYAETLYTTNMGTLLTSGGTDAMSGQMILNNNGGNGWGASGTYYMNASNMGFSTGGTTLGGTLDRVRVYTVNGTDTFDGGVIGLLYE